MARRYKNSDYSIWRFIANVVWITALPVTVAVTIYVLIDPFYVIGDGLLDSVRNCTQPYSRLAVNKGQLSLCALEQRIESGDVPDSFVFGASISCYYEVDYWNKYIDSSTEPMHFDSSTEGVRSLRLKLEYLSGKDIKIKNALVVIDPMTIEYNLTGDDIMSADPPEIGGRLTLPRWHLRFFRAFYDPDFMISYIPWRVTGTAKRYGHYGVFEPQPIVYDEYRNEESIPEWDRVIMERPEAFYAYRDFPVKRELHCSNGARVDADREKEFRRIAQLIKDADYHVIVSPMLSLDTLSSRDDALLREIFGAERYHNFSAKMSSVVLCDSNWYDWRHYRAPVAREIIDRVYHRD